MIRRGDLWPEDRDRMRPAWQPWLCLTCGRSIELLDGRWVHRWPLPGADHPAVPDEDAS